MNANEAIEYIHSRLKFGIHPGMERIEALCEELHNPQDSLSFIHVAGTNGKGSTSTMIASAFTAAGYKTGLFTSPYVVDFRERIQLDGEMISEKDLSECVEEVRKACDKLDALGIIPTEFETLTAAAFLYYKNQNCDIVVLETGLGGLLDSTNIIKTTLVSVITSVSMDHTNILGDTLTKIAQQKCGIIKPDRVTVMYPEQFEECEKVIRETAKEKNNKLVVPNLSECRIISEGIYGTDFEFDKVNYKVPFAGKHMVKNAITAITAVKMSGFKISNEEIALGISKATIPARMELIGSTKSILDGGHNEGCAKALEEFLKKFVSGRKVAVCGLMGDKDCDTYLKILAPHFDKMYLTRPDNPRSMACDELCELSKKYCKDCVPYEKPLEACEKALEDIKKKGGRVVVCGSFYLAGEIRNYMLENF